MRQGIIQQALGSGNATGASSVVVAAASVRALGALFAELEPLVGVQGSRAMYARCLHLTRTSFQWPVSDDLVPRNELLDVVHDHLAVRSPADARRAAEALLDAFGNLLVSLIGEALTLRLLQSAWGDPAAGTPSLENKK